MAETPDAEGPRTTDEQHAQKKQAALARAARRQQIAQLMHRRVPQTEIARVLGVSTGTVSEDIKKLKIEWKVDSQAAVEDHIAKELATMNSDENYWRLQMAAANLTIDQRLRIFDRIARIGMERRKMLGLDAPLRLDLAREEAVKFADQYGLDVNELIARAEQIMKEHASR